MEYSFPQFTLLPLELRRAIWHFAALGWTQDIHFQLSAPKEAWEEAPFDCRKHLFTSELSTPPLLYTCHDSRVAALELYTLGLNIEAKRPWTWVDARYGNDNDDRDRSRYTDCPYNERIAEFGKATYWVPDNDVVVLEHGIEPHKCKMRSICNSSRTGRQDYMLDERIRYMAITMDLWNCGSGKSEFDVPELEVLFVLVDPKPCFAFLGDSVRVLGTKMGMYVDVRDGVMRESCRIVGGQMTETLVAGQSLFQLKKPLGANLKVEVVLVGSIDELIEVVGQRRNERIRAAAKASTT